MEYFRNKFITMSYNESTKICTIHWKATTMYATQKDFINWNYQILKVCMEIRPKGFVTEMYDYKFIETPELQKWLKYNYFSELNKMGVTNFAAILPSEIFPKMSREETVKNIDFVEIKIFENVVPANNWLINRISVESIAQ